MKRITFAAIALMCTMAFGTVKAENNITPFVKGGLNLSSISKVDNSKLKVGFNVGVGADFALSSDFSIAADLELTQKGVKADYTQQGVKVNVTESPLYLEVPVLATYHFTIGETKPLALKFGPYFAYGIGGKNKVEAGGVSVKDDFFSDGVKKFDCGLCIGAQYNFTSQIFAGITGEFGMTKLYDNGDAKNTNIAISIGYSF